MQGAERQRQELEPRDLVLGAELLELERRLELVAAGHEQSDRLVLQAPDRICDDSGRRRVQPLDVVDRDQNRGRACERPDRSERSYGSLARLDGGGRARLAAEERDLERVPLRRR